MLSVVLKSIPLLSHRNFGVLTSCLTSGPNAEASGKVENGEERGLRGAQISVVYRGEEG